MMMTPKETAAVIKNTAGVETSGDVGGIGASDIASGLRCCRQHGDLQCCRWCRDLRGCMQQRKGNSDTATEGLATSDSASGAQLLLIQQQGA